MAHDPIDSTLSVAEGVLRFTQACHRPQLGPGRYVYTSDSDQPLAYCSSYGAMARHLCGDLKNADSSEIQAWAQYLQSFQCDDGLFRDPAFGLPDDLSNVEFAPNAGWDGGIAGWGWWHMTNHILCALDSLGAVAENPLRVLEPFYKGEIVLEEWLSERDWNVSWAVGNEILNLGTFLLYARDYQNEDRAADLIVRLFDWLDGYQDDETGYWGTDCHSRAGKLHAMCGAYHEIILYFYDKRPVLKKERMVDTTLSLQDEASGGFALDGTSGACEDIDAAFILINSFFRQDYRRDDIKASMARVLGTVIEHQNPDGGLVYRRGTPYTYGHDMMSSGADQSCLFPTWFRLLSVAIINQIVPHPQADTTNWTFNNCPYLHFFDEELVTQLK
jgi:hypothetical protein